MEKKSNNKYQRVVYGILHDRPIAFSPKLASVLGSINASILMGQLLYWRGKGAYGPWVYKTIVEMQEETGLTRSEQETAIRKCKEKEVLVTKLKGIPARRFFCIDIEKLVNEIDSWVKTSSADSHLCAEDVAVMRQTITESTQENTSDKTQENTPVLKKFKKRVMVDKNNQIKKQRIRLVRNKSVE